jgi:tRNA-Thr(GGU) m(6)t(6)A37 methyltransferase TsaA
MVGPIAAFLQSLQLLEASSMSNDDFGIREGEIAVGLPGRADASVYFIGRIHTPWKTRAECPKNSSESDAICTFEVDPLWAPAFAGIETCTHLVVLYWMHRSRRDLVVQVPRHYGTPRGTFALRSPARPNPIAMSVARLLSVDDCQLGVVGLDCLDDTPLLDLKPYFASTDAVSDAVVGWHADRTSSP